MTPASVEDALRRIRNGTVLLSWVLQLAESNDAPVHALEGASDICDDMEELAERLKATLEGMPKVLSADLVGWQEATRLTTIKDRFRSACVSVSSGAG